MPAARTETNFPRLHLCHFKVRSGPRLPRSYIVFGYAAALFLSLLASSEAGLFRRRAKGISSAGRSQGKEKVKESVAWLLEDRDGSWRPVSDDGRVKVWKREVPGSPFVAIKSSATLQASPQAIFEVLTPGDIEVVKQYNPLVEKGHDLEIFDRDNKVSWSATMGIWPSRPRDFVTRVTRATLDDGSVALVNSAATHPKAPESKAYVRGEILRGVFLIKGGSTKTQSEFTMVHHFNPGGDLPAWLINWLAEGKPSTFVRRLEAAAQTWDKHAASTKTMSCRGRGFADKPCAFLLPSRNEAYRTDNPDGTACSTSGFAAKFQRWIAAFAQVLAATGVTAVFGCLGWSVLMRKKGLVWDNAGFSRFCVDVMEGTARRGSEDGDDAEMIVDDMDAATSADQEPHSRRAKVPEVPGD